MFSSLFSYIKALSCCPLASASDDAERSMLMKMQAACGHEYVRRLTSMQKVRGTASAGSCSDVLQ